MHCVQEKGAGPVRLVLLLLYANLPEVGTSRFDGEHILPASCVEEAEMAEFYGPARRQIQDRFDTRRIADHFVDKIIGPAIREQDREFIVRVKATHVFPNCPRYIHEMAMV